MLVPNKIIPLDESCLYRATKLISKIDNNISIVELYSSNLDCCDGIVDFIDILDLLYVLEKIEVDKDGMVKKIA